MKRFVLRHKDMKKQIKKLLLTVLALVLLPAPTAYAADSEGLRIAIIDTGISATAVSAERIAAGKNYILPQENTEDQLGHGTAVASVIVGSEPAGVTGLCPAATLVPLVYSSRNAAGQAVQGGGDMLSQIICDAVDVYGCRIINISSGAKNGSDALRKACDYAEEKGALIVASAGNAGLSDPNAIYYPAAYKNVLSVGACDKTGKIADFSQKNNTVNLLACGVDLQMASVAGKPVSGQGTSFAAAVVSGMAAKLWLAQPELTAAQVREQLLGLTRSVDGWKVLETDAAIVAQPSEQTAFSDVHSTDYFSTAVLWAKDAGVTGGTSKTTFSPNAVCTRGQTMTLLWRAAGCPEAETLSGFADVDADSYCAKAVTWAVESGISTGTGSGSFSPDAVCTRGQIVAFLYRAAGSPETADTAVKFSDVAPGAYYADAVRWASANGIASGTGNGKFSPDTVCTRGQIVTLLYNYYGKSA